MFWEERDKAVLERNEVSSSSSSRLKVRSGRKSGFVAWVRPVGRCFCSKGRERHLGLFLGSRRVCGGFSFEKHGWRGAVRFSSVQLREPARGAPVYMMVFDMVST